MTDMKEQGAIMSKWILAALVILPTSAFSQPLTLEQAPNVVKKGQMEIGLEGFYGVDEFKLKGIAGTDFTETSGINALFLKYGLGQRVELKTAVPQAWWRLEQKTASTTTSRSESGIGDVSAGIKYNLGSVQNSFAAGFRLSFDFPTGNAENLLGKGFNMNPRIILSRRWGNWPVDLNVGYSLTGDCKVGGVKVNPGDVVASGISAGYLWDGVTFLTEVKGEAFGAEKQAGRKIAGSSGSRFDVTPGVRYAWKNFKAKAGVNVALGNESDRSYDWQAFAGFSILGRFSFRTNAD